MRQEKLEQKVRELFERQGFSVDKNGNRFLAEKDGQELTLRAFSSENFSHTDAEKRAEEGDKVFVDTGLGELKDQVDNDVSILCEEEEKPEYDLPSYEIIGEVALINQLREDMDREEAVEGILHYNPQVETILLKGDEGLKGEFRVGDYEKLYGGETETVHREFGHRFKVDPTSVYFSERFGTERKRVVDQIEKGEKVLVIGAGVGPFATMAAGKNPEKVLAVEKNPEAIEYLRENIELNNVEEKVEALKADATELDLNEKFDRIIIPIPGFADKFLETAFNHLKEGGKVHYYRFLEEDNWEQLENEIEEIANRSGIDYEIVDRVECGDRSPSETRVCIEIKKKEN